MTDAMQLEELKVQMVEIPFFLKQLRDLAAYHRVLEGTVFQEILRYCNGRHGSFSHPSNVLLGMNTLHQLVPMAQKMLQLFRIKVEDDNDLNLVRKAVRETSELLTELELQASQQNSTLLQLVQIMLR